MTSISAPRRAPAPGGGLEGAAPRLRVVGPPTRRRAPWSLRPTLVVVVALVLGSLLMVAGAQAYLTQEQVRLTTIQTQLTAQVAEHHDLEYRVAQLSNPAHIVGAAQRQGLTVPSQVTDLTPVTVPPTTHLASTIKTTSSAKTAPSSQTKTTTPTRHGSHARASGAGGR